MSISGDSRDQLCINTIRMLSADAVQAANSGHPGLPLGAAPMAYVLWDRFIRYNPDNPLWPNRDRFILSAGHGSAMLYAVLHLCGFQLSLDDLKNFRQWQSKTPGHPEYGHTAGVEATTGPLGQGFAMGVGMALAERFLAARFNRQEFPVVDHYTYAIVSDGDLMEGISSEAASLAGHLGLGKLVYLYDDNKISIEGSTDIAFTEDVETRFKAFGWQTLRVADANDVDAIVSAVETARADKDRPSLILVRSEIGYGSPKQGSEKAHGEPLGKDGLAATKKNLGWPEEPAFYVPDEVRSSFGDLIERSRANEPQWNNLLDRYRKDHPETAAELDTLFKGELPAGWDAEIPRFKTEDGPIATRSASGKVLNAIAARVPTMLGGSADLAPSTKTIIAHSRDQSKDTPEGRNIRFGVREHAMGAMVNGMALHGGVVPYGATFLIFSDYMRASLRLSALMSSHSIFVFTHDSIGVGEDGPTHQPIEHLASLRAMPNMTVLRPADANETACAWKVAMELGKPVCFALTRQNMPILDMDKHPGIAEGVKRGAYVLSDSDGAPDVIIIASGSEVNLALQAQDKLLSEKGIKARVVSMPSWELFSEQPSEYRDEALPPSIKARLAVEAGSSLGWRRWIGDEGDIIAIDHFGASAPGGVLMKAFGFDVDNVVAKAAALVKA